MDKESFCKFVYNKNSSPLKKDIFSFFGVLTMNEVHYTMTMWEERSELKTKNNIEELRKVIDPQDLRGIKNTYIDIYLKYYLKKYLSPNKKDIILDIGCGIGRLTQFISNYVKISNGIDLVDKFIDDCRIKFKKSKNTNYYKLNEITLLSKLDINKVFVVWVLMYFNSDSDLLETLMSYKNNLPTLEKLVFIEQVKIENKIETLFDNFYCKYRTIDTYKSLFEKAGLKVEKIILMGERKYGLVNRYLFSNVALYNRIPNLIFYILPLLFYLDKFFMDKNIIKRKIRNDDVAYDVLFLCKVL